MFNYATTFGVVSALTLYSRQAWGFSRMPGSSNYIGRQLLRMSSVGGGVDNPMNPNIYTEKAWDAIGKLPSYGDKYSTQNLEACHLLRALLDEGAAGLTQRILAKAGVETKTLDRKLEDYLSKQPKVSDTSSKSIGRTMLNSLQIASKYKVDFADQFISTEHLLLGVADAEGFTKKLFSEMTSTQKLLEAVKSIRGKNKVTSRNPEVTYEALQKYARDLTEAAKEGKLDPVIGRDEEIRRAIQILSRRTKNNPILLGA